MPLQLENIDGTLGIQVSTSFVTPGGDQIRVIRPVSGKAVIKPVDPDDDLIISIVAPPGVLSTLDEPTFAGLWDGVKKVAKSVVGFVLDAFSSGSSSSGSSGGCDPQTGVEVKFDSNGRVTSVKADASCTQT